MDSKPSYARRRRWRGMTSSVILLWVGKFMILLKPADAVNDYL
jgi:hypothetical protein